VKRALLAAAAVALLAAHFAWWYLPRERAVTPRLRPPASRRAAGPAGPDGEPLQLLAAGAYDVCLWVPYPHQNLGVLAGAVGDLQDVLGAAQRLGAGEASPRRSGEPQEAPGFGPFEVPPASELVACSDLAGGRLRVVARIYPALSVVAKLAGRLAGNPWLAGGAAGRMRIAWSGRLWSVTGGDERPPAAVAPPGFAAPAGSAAAAAEPGSGAVPSSGSAAPFPPPGPAASAAGSAPPATTAADPAAARLPIAPPSSGVAGAATGAMPELPESLAVVHWTGVRTEIPAGYYALTRRGQDLAVSLVGAGGGGETPMRAAAAVAAGPLPALLMAVGAEWPAGGVPPATRPLLPPAALALFEAGGSRVSSLGSLPGLAVFNAAGAAGAERWRLPTEGVLRLLAGRLPAAELAGWRIVALDKDSLRQAQALAPRLAALLPSAVPGGPAAAAAPAPHLSLGVWLEPRSALSIVSRIRRFVEAFPLASRRQVELWRDWETVLDPLANCEHATLAATAEPPAMRLLLQGCAAPGPPAPPAPPLR
jgi:hypothetical protein